MKSFEKYDLHQKLDLFLDGKLSRKEEIDVISQIANDEEARELLRLDLNLARNLHENPASFSVPEGFSDQVMAEIKKIEANKEGEKASFFKLSNAIKSLGEPREVAFRPASILLAAALVLVVFTGLFNLNSDSVKQQKTTIKSTEMVSDSGSDEVWIRFVYIDDGASKLAVAGNFSDWEPIEMDRRIMGGKTIWSGLVPVERGEHRYMFVRNGDEWISDPLAEIQRDDGFGNKNAVIYL